MFPIPVIVSISNGTSNYVRYLFVVPRCLCKGLVKPVELVCWVRLVDHLFIGRIIKVGVQSHDPDAMWRR